MVTIKDLARRVGVAPSTVARALADHPHVRESTKARVRAEAAALGYVAHAAARAMRGRHSGMVGLMVPDVRNPFYASAAQALSEAATDAGLQLLLAITGDDPARELAQLTGLVSARCAGIVIVPSPRPERGTLALLRRAPHVQLIRRARGLDAPWFGIDDAAATALAAEHLAGLGHRRIGYVGVDLALSTGAARYAGFAGALARHGLAPDPALCVHGPGDPEGAARAVRGLLAAKRRPTGLVLASARLAGGALEAIAAAGVAVPRDLSLVGFHDASALGVPGAGLTSVGLPVREIALACAAALVAAIRTGHAAAPVAAAFAPFLVERGSTAPPPVSAARRPRRAAR